MRPFKSLSFLFLLFLSAAAIAATAPRDAATADGAREKLRSAYQQVAPRLSKSPFGKPLHLEAKENENRLDGHAYALLAHAFKEAAPSLAEAREWCDILMLPFNTKNCEVASSGAADRPVLTLFVGRKTSTPLDRTHRLELRFQVVAKEDDYLQVVLTAPEGPFGTRDYRIVLELAPADGGRTFLHLGYSYQYGTLARTAMQAYLATAGSHKVGFTIEGKDEQGQPVPVRGVRGVMERNTMRYYLAIEAYLNALRAAPADRPARMIEGWIDAVERYPRQLRELERGEYISMKRGEFERMRSGLSPARRTASSSP